MILNTIEKNCKLCGRAFVTDKTATLYCSDRCREDAQKINNRRYRQTYRERHKLRKQSNATQVETTQNETPAIQNETIHVETIQLDDRQNDIVIETLEKSIADNLELLDAVRDELSKILNDLSARQSAYDQKDFTLLHQIEGTEDKNALLQLALQCKENRKNRRDYKNYIQLLRGILKYIPVESKKSLEKMKETQTYKDTFYRIKY